MKVIPIQSKQALEVFKVSTDTFLPLPLVAGAVPAGFPSPAADFEENHLDLNQFLIKNKSSTFFARVQGHSMKDAGINDGDIMIIDKSIEPQNNDIAICYIDGEFTVKRLLIEKDVVWLMPENEKYEPIKTTAENDLLIWGKVIFVIKSFK